MRKLAYVLGIMFATTMAISTYASTVTVENNVMQIIVDQNNDEKPCPANCTCEKCEKAKAANAENKEAKADCNKEAKADCKEKKAECDKAETKPCCSKTEKKAESTEKK